MASSTAPGLREPVEVLRDRYGVAYISADSLEDLWFAQGFVTAGERLFQIDLALKQANGRLSELFGERTLDDDRFTRTVGINRAGATIAAGWDDTSRAMIARFREGVVAWIAAMPAPPVEYVAARCVARAPRRRRLVGGVLGDVLLGPLRQLGLRAAPRAPRRGAG